MCVSVNVFNCNVYMDGLYTNTYIYLRLKLKENSIRFQFWPNFVPCVHLSFSIFVLSDLISVKY